MHHWGLQVVLKHLFRFANTGLFFVVFHVVVPPVDFDDLMCCSNGRQKYHILLERTCWRQKLVILALRFPCCFVHDNLQPPLSLSSGLTLFEVAKKMADIRTDAAILLDAHGQVEGIVTDHDITRQVKV